MMRSFYGLFIGALLVFGTLAVAEAAKPTPFPDAELHLVGASPQAGGEAYSIAGTGFPASAGFNTVIREPFCCAASGAVSDADGNVLFTRQTAAPGTYQIDIWWTEQREHGKSRRHLLATAYFVVLPAD